MQPDNSLPGGSNTQIKEGLVKDNDGWRYYISGVAQAGWVTINEKQYYFLSDTFLAATGDHIIEQKKCTFDENGVLISSVPFPSGLYMDGALLRYRDPSSGVDAVGKWIVTNNCAYYFAVDGYAVTGEQVIDGIGYNFNSGFALITGLYQDHKMAGGAYRYIDPTTFELKTGWLNYNNSALYYFDGASRASVIGANFIDGVGYYFGNNYALQTGLYQDNVGNALGNGPLRYIDPTTFVLKTNSWYTHINGNVYFFNADGRSVKGNVEIGGAGYHFDENGYHLWTGLYFDNIFNTLRFYDKSKNALRVNEWYKHNENELYYFDANGAACKGETVVKGVTYQFSKTGALISGALYRDWASDPVNGALRYIDPKTFDIHSGWLQYNGNLYYMDPRNGLSVFGNSVPINGVGYNFGDNNSFALITGRVYRDWVADTANGALRYIHPKTFEIHSGWLQYDSNLYYMDPRNGLSVFGNLVPINGVGYNFGDNNSFALITGKIYRDWVSDPVKGALRYIDPQTFAIHSGWLDYDNNKYYMDPRNGLSVTGEILINRKYYVFNEGFAYQRMYMKGFDVSAYQREIDWTSIPPEYGYVIVRAMSWANNNTMQMDPYFVKNVFGAKETGLMVGAYWFSFAFNGNEALQEVQFINNSKEWNTLKSFGVVLDLPFYIDYEDNSSGWIDRNTTYASRTEAVRHGMIYAESILKVKPGFYSSANQMQSWYDSAGLIKEGYYSWVAEWKTPTKPGVNTSKIPNVGMWQYDNDGSISGISGRVDINYCFQDFTFTPLSSTQPVVSVYDQNSKSVVSGKLNDIVKMIV
ncbi:MAG: GH25 family lysozyme, partial [Christensenella sp.]